MKGADAKGWVVRRSAVLGVLAVVGLIFVGWVVLSLLGTLFKILMYLLVGALVVGGVALAVSPRARGMLRSVRRRQVK